MTGRNDAVRWLFVASVPALAFIVGAVALPRPRSVADELADVDKGALGASVSRTQPKPRTAIEAELGDVVRVLGADLPEGGVSRGTRLSVRFYFAADAALDRDWQIFVHVDAKAGGRRIHGDHFPVGGKYPTTLWQRGDFIADDWSTFVPKDAPAGVYDVWVGFYVGDDRLPWSGGAPTAHDGDDRVRVGSIVVQ